MSSLPHQEENPAATTSEEPWDLIPRLAVEWLDINVIVKTPKTRKTSFKVTQSPTSIAVQPSRHLLRSVYGEALPGELIVLMGPSGAGKSTLMDCIAGRNPHCTGTVHVNGQPWDSRIAKRSCYVMQDDLFYANLTVLEHLTFQAELRMSCNMTMAQRQKRVTTVIRELGLTPCRTTLIGGGMVKGLSGGQRKRLSFATELLTNPSLLFIDEPTSGLDSFMAETVIKQMRDLARHGRTVITTIHQPSSELFELFDRLYLLVNGRTVYHGPASKSIDYFASQGYQCPSFMNPTDYFMKILAVMDDQLDSQERVKQLADSWQIKTLSDGSESQERRKSIALLSQSSPTKTKATGQLFRGNSGIDAPTPEVVNIGMFRQLLILCQRHWLRLVRDDVSFKARVGSTIFVNIIAGLVFRNLQRDQPGVQNFTGAIFFISVSQLFLCANPEFATVPLELPLILREHEGSLYHIWNWYLAKNVMEIPLQLVLPLLFLVPMYFLMGFDTDATMFFMFYMFSVLSASSATALGYLVASISKRVDLAPVIGLLFMLPFILFGGMFLNGDSTPSYFRWLQAISPVMYCFHGMMRAFWGSVKHVECRAGQLCLITDGTQVLKMNSIENGASVQYVTIVYLLAINIGLRLIGAVLLWLHTDKNKKVKLSPIGKQTTTS